MPTLSDYPTADPYEAAAIRCAEASIRERPDEPLVSGHTQGRHPRECGPKGATLVDVIDRAIQTEERTLDQVRWDVVRIDAEHLADSDQLFTQAQDQLTAALASLARGV